MLARALRWLESRTGSARARLATALAALRARQAPRRSRCGAAKRMGLERPRGLAEWLQQRLVVLALDATAAPRPADAPAPPR